MPSQWRLLMAATYASPHSISAPAGSFCASAASTCASGTCQATSGSAATTRSARYSTPSSARIVITSIETAARANEKDQRRAPGSLMTASMSPYISQARYHPEIANKAEYCGSVPLGPGLVGAQELNTTLTGS